MYYKIEAKKFDREVMTTDREAGVNILRSNLNAELLKVGFLSNGDYFEKADSIFSDVKPDLACLSDELLFLLVNTKNSKRYREEAFIYFELAISMGKDIVEHCAAESTWMIGCLEFENKKYTKVKEYTQLSTYM